MARGVYHVAIKDTAAPAAALRCTKEGAARAGLVAIRRLLAVAQRPAHAFLCGGHGVGIRAHKRYALAGISAGVTGAQTQQHTPGEGKLQSAQ